MIQEMDNDSTGLIQSAHKDLVTDASYDFYGLRLATCSLDQRIKIWRLDENNGTWSVEDDWKAHDAAVSKLSWAHPEFGSIIASSSFDRTVKVWEQVLPGGQPISNGSNSRWAERAATIASDNFLRIYECLEQPSLTTWHLSEEIDTQNIPSSASPSYLSRAHTIVATPTQSNATLDGASASLVAQALQQGLQQGPIPMSTRPGLGNREADGGWCLSWCKDRYWGEIIAAGSGVSGIIKLIQLTPSRKPSTLLTLDPSPTPPPTSSDIPPNPAAMQTDTEPQIPVPFAITSVAWAPSCGRSYHLIATGGRDGHVRIWKVRPGEYPDDDAQDDAEAEEPKWTATIVADFDQHKSAVGRVEWNITGTVLSSAGNDGRIRLWKATSGNVWRPAGSIGVEQVEAVPPGKSDVDMDA
ncbi:WD40-repeat-containing domain protein [Infundibulicybe gibba]|nr:WD40-repeat-containing domain protein [Infundibulicybe gibba]